jgi:hypothetical protein
MAFAMHRKRSGSHSPLKPSGSLLTSGWAYEYSRSARNSRFPQKRRTLKRVSFFVFRFYLFLLFLGFCVILNYQTERREVWEL